jgi:hypothetical protein
MLFVQMFWYSTFILLFVRTFKFNFISIDVAGKQFFLSQYLIEVSVCFFRDSINFCSQFPLAEFLDIIGTRMRPRFRFRIEN